MTRSCEHKFETLENYGEIKPFSYIDINGKKRISSEFDGDIVKIATELRRGERSVRMNLFFIGLISESEVNKKLIIDC